MTGDHDAIRVEIAPPGVATVTLDRPEARNAFDAGLVAELAGVAERLGGDDGVRVVVLTGAGDVFSAGADLGWMRDMKQASRADNLADARRLGATLRALDELPKPLVGRINGHALGGGAGLVAVCDVAVASEDAVFGFPEVTLGLAPAVIAPYVVRKVGRSFARSVFVTGERFPAARALEVGLVHELVPADVLDEAVDDVVDRCLRAGPHAVAVAKRLPELALGPPDEAAEQMAGVIADLRAGEEAQEGMEAFFDRRPPAWRPNED